MSNMQPQYAAPPQRRAPPKAPEDEKDVKQVQQEAQLREAPGDPPHCFRSLWLR